MASRAFVSVADHENEKSSVLFWVQDVGAGNYAAVTQDIDEVKDAIDTIVLGTITQAGFTKTFPEAVGYPSTDPNAQREAKWLITYQDIKQFLDVANTIANPGYLKVFTADIPTADLALLPDGEDEMDIFTPASVGALFKSAWEVNVRTPYNHTGAQAGPHNQVLSIKHVGRNN